MILEKNHKNIRYLWNNNFFYNIGIFTDKTRISKELELSNIYE